MTTDQALLAASKLANEAAAAWHRGNRRESNRLMRERETLLRNEGLWSW